MGNIGEKRLYNKIDGREDVILWEVIDFDNSATFKVNFISTNSQFKQGIRFAVDCGDGDIEINGCHGKEFILMEDTCPKDAIVKVTAESGKLSIYNVYERADGNTRSLGDYSGMLLTEKSNVRVYSCKTSSLEDFDTLVFSVEEIQGKMREVCER